MALSFKCEFCGKDIVVKYLRTGEKALCRNCGKYVAVPQEAEEIQLSPEEWRSTIETDKSTSITEVSSTPITNPWTGIWFYPREAVRLTLERDRHTEACALAAIYGIVHNFHLMWRYGFAAESGTPLWVIVVVNLLGGAALGYSMLFVSSWLVSLVSRLLGGLGSARNARIAIGWSCLPYVALLVIVPLIFIEPNTFVYHPSGQVFVTQLSKIYFVLRAIMTIWSLVLIVTAISEALRLSILKSIVSLLALAIFLGLATFSLMLLIGMLF